MPRVLKRKNGCASHWESLTCLSPKGQTLKSKDHEAVKTPSTEEKKGEAGGHFLGRDTEIGRMQQGYGTKAGALQAVPDTAGFI